MKFESTDPVEQFLIDVHRLCDRDGRVGGYRLGEDPPDELRIARILVAKITAMEREACAKVAGWLWQQFQDTKDAHERNSMEPFMPGQFGFDQSTVQQSKRMMDAIRARGQA